jgi:hypothetical protein
MKSSKNMKTYNGQLIRAHTSSKLSSEGEFHYFLVVYFIWNLINSIDHCVELYFKIPNSLADLYPKHSIKLIVKLTGIWQHRRQYVI